MEGLLWGLLQRYSSLYAPCAISFRGFPINVINFFFFFVGFQIVIHQKVDKLEKYYFSFWVILYMAMCIVLHVWGRSLILLGERSLSFCATSLRFYILCRMFHLLCFYFVLFNFFMCWCYLVSPYIEYIFCSLTVLQKQKPWDAWLWPWNGCPWVNRLSPSMMSRTLRLLGWYAFFLR